MTSPPLPGRALRHLRALGHALDPVIHVGKQGVTEALVKQTVGALLQHELIKVRVQPEAPLSRKETAIELARATDATLAQVLGRTFLLYKRHPKKPKIVLPRAPEAGPGEGAAKAKGAKVPKGAKAPEAIPEDGEDGGIEEV